MKELFIIVGILVLVIVMYKNDAFETTESNLKDAKEDGDARERRRKELEEEDRIKNEKEDEARRIRNKENMAIYRKKYEKSKIRNKAKNKICRSCGGTHFVPVKQGFGFGKAVVGTIVAGPLGIAAGGINKNKIKFVCATCGTYKK